MSTSVPVSNVILPPVIVVAMPAVATMEPAKLAALEPPFMAIEPDLAVTCPAADPDVRTTLPDAPVVVDPDENSNAPLMPPVPAPALSTATLPEERDDDEPDEYETTPPVLATEIPADTET